MKPDFLTGIATSIVAVGSRVTCNPPPTDTDEDWLVWVSDKRMSETVNLLVNKGFNLDKPNDHYRPENNEFNSWRGPENTNLIVTADMAFYNKFLLATDVAKKLNLMTKRERVIVFQAILYGRHYQ